MNYESKLFVGMPYTTVERDGLTMLQVVAQMDLSAVGNQAVGRLLRASREADGQLYKVRDVCGKMLRGDGYDQPLKEVDLDALIAALQDEIAEGGKFPYRCFVVALALFQSFRENRERFDYPAETSYLKVVQYGY